MHTDRIRKGEPPMKKKGLSTMIVGKFKSIQSVIFATVAFLVLSAVVIVTGVSMRLQTIPFLRIPQSIPIRSSSR